MMLNARLQLTMHKLSRAVDRVWAGVFWWELVFWVVCQRVRLTMWRYG